MTLATLLIFAKPPRIGLSKTRLAQSLSPTSARRIATMTAARTLNAARAECGWQTHLYLAPDSEVKPKRGGLWPAHLPRFSQGRGDLTARLNKGLAEAPCGKVLFIGTDAPDTTPGLLRNAVRTLDNHDAVFGPATDGGFWLFGLRKNARMQSPFGRVRWSGPHAMADVSRNLPETARICHLPTLIDIDDADDWRAWNSQ